MWTLMSLDSINQQSLATCVCGGSGDEGASGVWGLGAHLQRGLWSPPSLDMPVVTAGFRAEQEHENQTPEHGPDCSVQTRLQC